MDGDILSSEINLPDVIQGYEEPENSKVILSLIGAGLLGIIVLFTVVFNWNDFPIVGEVVPFFDVVGTSGIWYYMIGIFIGFTLIITSMMGEALRD